ncbi:hypothetical protein HH800_12880 [Sphingobium yanoikuyae]|uniref:Polyhydroxyalkanoic acid system protein n=1 Tax=Sphingobium yanoikuyae TaxID=13690 RepID=A0A6M4G7Q1_SPHYA|nr:polyhydroxyalkanoic acid system family protein [Sphingobium yanoikuyae]QJR02986.1 hypothetical protein HH800_12880 [Sphingobium yanoikuyae]
MDIDIPHDLGRDEAKRRVEQGLPKLEQHIPGGGTMTATWPSDYTLDMEISAMAQTIPVKLLIEEDKVRGTVSIPMFLKMMSGPISDFIKTSAQKMLTKA